jgi:hypothetical protein
MPIHWKRYNDRQIWGLEFGVWGFRDGEKELFLLWVDFFREVVRTTIYGSIHIIIYISQCKFVVVADTVRFCCAISICS